MANSVAKSRNSSCWSVASSRVVMRAISALRCDEVMWTWKMSTMAAPRSLTSIAPEGEANFSKTSAARSRARCPSCAPVSAAGGAAASPPGAGASASVPRNGASGSGA